MTAAFTIQVLYAGNQKWGGGGYICHILITNTIDALSDLLSEYLLSTSSFWMEINSKMLNIVV